MYDGGFVGCGASGATAMKTAVGLTLDAPKGCNAWGQCGQTQLDRVEPDAVLVNVAWDVVQTKSADLADAYCGQLKRVI